MGSSPNSPLSISPLTVPRRPRTLLPPPSSRTLLSPLRTLLHDCSPVPEYARLSPRPTPPDPFPGPAFPPTTRPPLCHPSPPTTTPPDSVPPVPDPPSH
ncbi:hypothetical protein WJX84_002607 [Apatococcus fuscideae]|uniref:Uncharacterized protein n=1 Tax=Apatococcus fuscideae TaxID=2026836 RepID=A0AAW1T7G3_9CHLO